MARLAQRTTCFYLGDEVMVDRPHPGRARIVAIRGPVVEVEYPGGRRMGCLWRSLRPVEPTNEEALSG